MMRSTALDHASSDLAWHHLDTARTATAPPCRAAGGCAEPRRPPPCWIFYYGDDDPYANLDGKVTSASANQGGPGGIHRAPRPNYFQVALTVCDALPVFRVRLAPLSHVTLPAPSFLMNLYSTAVPAGMVTVPDQTG
jgi:hypothetical protein